jgi:hypothetical protein
MKALWLCIIATLIITGEAQGAQLCKTRYTDRGDLERTLQSQRGQFFTGKGVRSVIVSSPTRLSLWWLTSPSSRAYPTIACVEKLRERDGTFRQHKAEANCDGAELNTCEDLRHEIAKAKF